MFTDIYHACITVLKEGKFLFLLFFLLFSSKCYAETLKSLPETIQGSDSLEMILVPAGEFLMGSFGDNYPVDERPRHKVFLNSYYIDRYEVNNELFVKFLNSVVGPKDTEERKKWIVIRSDLDDPAKTSWFPAEIEYRQGRYFSYRGFKEYPVITVSWYAAAEYCKWVGERLPTEAEWEKAARGGLEGKDYPWGNQMPNRESGLVFSRRWTDNSLSSPIQEVKKYPANGFGLYGMAGNVQEWCSDWYASSYYRESAGKNPLGPSTGQKKVQRGGSWASPAVGIRAAVRWSSLPSSNSTSSGFRCVRDAD